MQDAANGQTPGEDDAAGTRMPDFADWQPPEPEPDDGGDTEVRPVLPNEEIEPSIAGTLAQASFMRSMGGPSADGPEPVTTIPHAAPSDSTALPVDTRTIAASAEELGVDEAAGDGGGAPRPGRSGRSIPARDVVGKSAWNLKIHAREVRGELTGLSGSVHRAGHGLSSAIVNDPDAPEYEIQGRLGSGSMGVVHRAVQTSVNRDVAIKSLKPEGAGKDYTQAMFVSEAVVTANLVHPNIVPIHDLGRTSDGKLFYAMKRVTGQAWDQTIRRRGNLEEKLDVLLKVCDAVAYAHSRGVINRDLKPENVVLGDFGEVIVLDWGLALTTEQFDRRDSVMTNYQGGAGTPVYMPPELLDRDVSRVCPQSDIYLLGAMLYEAIAGFPPHYLRRLWDLGNAKLEFQGVLQAVRDNEIEAHAPGGELMAIARKAMATEPTDRYATVEAFQDAVREYRITGRAEELLTAAASKGTGSYDRHQKAVALFEEASERWTDNRRAEEGGRRARIGYAKMALAKADLDLAAEVLGDHPGREFDALRAKVRRRRRRRGLTKATLAVLFLAAVGGMFASTALWREATASEERALREKDRAEAALKESVRLTGEVDTKQKKILAKEQELAYATAAVEDAKKDLATAEQEAKAERERLAEENRLAMRAASEKSQKELEAAEAANAEKLAKANRLNEERIAKADAAAEEKVRDAERLEKEALAAKEKAEEDAAAATAAAARQQDEARKALVRAFDTKVLAAAELGDYPYAASLLREVLADGATDPVAQSLNGNKRKTLEQRLREYASKAAPEVSIHAVEGGVKLAASHAASGRTAVLTQDETLRILGPGGEELAADVSGADASDRVFEVAFTADGSAVAVVGTMARFWRRDGNAWTELASDRGDASAVAYKFALADRSRPDRLLLIRGDGDGTVEFWSLGDAAATRLSRAALGPDGRHKVRSAALTPDGRHLLVTGTQEVLRAYPITAGTRPGIDTRNPADGGNLKPTLLTVSPDGQYLAGLITDTRTDRRAIAVMPRGTGGFPFDASAMRTIPVAPKKIYRIAFSPDSSRMAVAALGRYVALWDIADGSLTPVRVRGMQRGGFLPVHDSGNEVMKSVAFAGDRETLLTVSTDDTVRRTPLTAFEEIVGVLERLAADLQSEGQTSEVRRPRPPSERELIAAMRRRQGGARSRTWPVFQRAEPGGPAAEPVRIRQPGSAYTARFSPDDRRVLVGGDDRAAHVYDAATGQKSQVDPDVGGRKALFFDPNNVYLEGHIPEMSAIRFLPPDGDLLLTQDYFGSISVWDAQQDADGVGFERSRLLSEYSLSEFAVSSDGGLVLAGGAKVVDDTPGQEQLDHFALLWKRSDIWDREDGSGQANPRNTLLLRGEHPRFAITSLAISGDGTRAVTAGRRGKIVLWDLRDGSVIARASDAHNRDQVAGAAFLSDGRILTAGYDGQVLRWTAEADRLRARPLKRPGGDEANPDFIIRMRLSPDGRRLATSEVRNRRGEDGQVRGRLTVTVWDLEGETRELFGESIPECDRGKAFRHDISWSSDGSRIMLIVDTAAGDCEKSEDYEKGSRIALFDAETLEPVKGFRDSGLHSLRASLKPSEGEPTQLATFDGEVAHLWSLETRQHLTAFRAHASVYAADYSPDGRYVFTGSESVRVFNADRGDINHGQTLFRVSDRDHRAPIESVAVRPGGGDSYRFASVDRGGQLNVYDWTPGVAPPAEPTHTAAPPDAGGDADFDVGRFGSCVTFRPDGAMMAAVQRGHLRLWPAAAGDPAGGGKTGGKPIDVPPPAGQTVRWNAVRFASSKTEDGRWLLAAGGLAYDEDLGEARSMAVVYAIAEGGTPRPVLIASGRHSVEFRDRAPSGVTAVAIADGVLWTGGGDGTLNRWLIGRVDGETVARDMFIADRRLRDGSSPHSGEITSIDVSADGRVVTSARDGLTWVWPAP